MEKRTRHISIALEDIYQPYNASATIRTADCLGLQDIHIIENRNSFEPRKRAMRGADKWMDLHRYNSNTLENINSHEPETFSQHHTIECLNKLKKEGYQLIATSPGDKSISLNEISLKSPTVFLFGTEKHGLSKEALEMSDETLRLPMVGFTESYNISVAVAMTLSHTMNRLWNSDINWQLREKEKNQLKAEWYKRAIGEEKAEMILARGSSE